MMPVADFPGRFGWGYDGVDLYAPTRLYGAPDDLRAFVDRAHALGIGVILDVVYNHLGPDGNYLAEFSPDYFTDRYKNDWGEAINFDGPQRGRVREFFVANAGYWIDEFHFDGLRLDATQDINDASPEHIVAEIVARAREAAGARHLRSSPRTSRRTPRSSATRRGRLRRRRALERRLSPHRGGRADRRGARRTTRLQRARRRSSSRRRSTATSIRGSGTLAEEAPRHAGPRSAAEAFVTFLENHDQVANSAVRPAPAPAGRARALLRAMTALLLLGPATPMLFQGQEFASSAPFLYFADHKPELPRRCQEGGASSSRSSRASPIPTCWRRLPAPVDEETFRALQARSRRARASTAVLRAAPRSAAPAPRPIRCCARIDGGVDGAGARPGAFVLRFFGGDDGDRLLLVNLGATIDLHALPEPLLAPPADCRWDVLWSSEAPRYGGSGGTPPCGSRPCSLAPLAPAAPARATPSRTHRMDSTMMTPDVADHFRRPRITSKATIRRRAASGWSPTGSAATPPGPLRAW